MFLQLDARECKVSLQSDMVRTNACCRFQLAAVHITFLCQMDTEEDIRASLKDLPDTLTKAYDEIYKGILEQKGSAPQLALNALRWVKFSYEPLASDTLLDAVIMAQVSKTGDYPASQSITNDTILKVCQNLLVLDDRLQIYRFAHLSVDEYLETKFNNSKVDSHAYIAESCLSLLCSPKPFEKYDQTIFTEEGQYANRHILLYSAAFWPWHFVRYEELKLENGHSEVLERLWERFMMQSNYQKWLNYHYAVIKTEESNNELFWQKLHAFANEQTSDRIYATCIFGLSRRFKVLFELRRNVLDTEISVGKLLCYASRFGYVELVQYLLANKADVSAVGENRSTPLHFASENGHEEVAQLLLDKGANVSTTNNYGWTPLHLASQNGHEVARLLLEMDANISAADNYGWTPLHFACLNGHEVAGLLLEKGANLSSTDNDGWMPLHLACQNGHETVVQLLLEKGANISAKGENGSTPLHLALQNEQDSVVQLLLDMGADLSAAGDYGWTPLHLALQNGSEAVALLLLERGVDFSVSGGYGSTPLHLASQYGYEEVVRKLLDQGASFSAADNYGSTALHLASHHGHEMAARLLLNMDANLSTTDNHGLTPLHLASQNRQAAVTQLLLDNGASISSTSNFGWTPLHFACQNGSEEVARLLIENGANIDIADDNGLTPLHLTLRNGHKVVAKLLLQKSACADVSAAKTNGLASLNLYEEVAQLLQ